jgi:hypothetical protein
VEEDGEAKGRKQRRRGDDLKLIFNWKH